MMLGAWPGYTRVNAVAASEENEDQELGQASTANASTSTQAADNAVSLTIDGGTVDNSVTETVQGQTAYHSHSVQVSGKDITAYTLTISGPTNLAGTSTISGAGGKYGYELSPNTWGYGWGDTSTTDANLAYQTLTTGGKSLDCGSVTNDNLECNKKLTFAASFGEDVATGNYTANVNLQLTATPRVVSSWNTMKYMQDMKAEYCDEPATPAKGATNVPTKTLIDRRDGKGYTIVKLHDGNCWMQENLRLGGASTILLTSNDTDVASNYILPASSDDSWNRYNYSAQQIRVGKVGMTVSTAASGDGNGWQLNYGNYYSWCAATAGTCSESESDNVNVSGSICPKGWHLPSGGSTSATSGGVGTDSEFYKLTNGLSMSTITASPYLYPIAGYIDDKGLNNPGVVGFYWSRTSSKDFNGYPVAYILSFYSTAGLSPGTGGLSNGVRYRGFPVRCIANY